MAYEIRRVPGNWQHPKDADGRYIGLFETSRFKRDAQRWDEENEMWLKGYRSDGRSNYVPIEPEHQHKSYVEWTQERPELRNYMPQWANDERTHYMIYESVTEGTPISPAFRNAVDLLNWLIAENVKESQDRGKEITFWKRWVQQEIKAANLTCGILRGCALELEIAGH
jgi:hypothetical protein